MHCFKGFSNLWWWQFANKKPWRLLQLRAKVGWKLTNFSATTFGSSDDSIKNRSASGKIPAKTYWFCSREMRNNRWVIKYPGCVIGWNKTSVQNSSQCELCADSSSDCNSPVLIDKVAGNWPAKTTTTYSCKHAPSWNFILCLLYSLKMSWTSRLKLSGISEMVSLVVYACEYTNTT